MPDERCDFLIITALPEERNAVLALLPQPRQQKPRADSIYHYYRAELPVAFPDGTTGSYSLALTTSLGMGRVNAAVITTAAMRDWQPRYVLLVGIAAGAAANEIGLGDILLADQIIDYELQKVTEAGPEIRWQVHQADPRLRLAANNFTSTAWRRRIRAKRAEGEHPHIHFGPIATGDKVAKTDALFAMLLVGHAANSWR